MAQKLINLTGWVLDNFAKRHLVSQKFNVHCYSELEIKTAMIDLASMGYKAELENNGNSLNVTNN